jgi:hypothetical protein
MKMEKPRPSPAGPQKNPCTQLSAHANIHGSPAQGGLNAKLPHLSGRAIEDAHDEAPKTTISNARRNSPRRRYRVYTTKSNGLSVRYFTIAEALSWPGSYGDANSAVDYALG